MKFLLTRELGRLAKWLRILGFDTEYFKENNAGSLIIRALREERIIVTRNQRLPKPRGLKVILIKSENLKSQIAQIQEALKIKLNQDNMFTRCIICNEKLASIEKEKVKDRVPEYVFNTQEDFITCPRCKRIYWQGTHWGNVKATLGGIG
jgi:uncharacterized protein with PIN domain